MIVLARFVADRRRSLRWWAVGLVAVVAFTMALFPTVEGDASFDELVEELPEAMRSLFNIDAAVPVSSAPGYLHGRLFSAALPVLLIVFAIGLGARAIGGAEEDGTLELLLSNPVSRRRVVAERLAGLVAMVVALGAVATVSVMVFAVPFGALDGVSIPGLIGASAGATALGLLHGSIAFLVGAARGRRGPAVAVATSIAVGGYLLQGVLGLSDALDVLRVVTPWHWYLGRNMLVGGVAPDAIVAPVAVAAVLAAAAFPLFERRDLR